MSSKNNLVHKVVDALHDIVETRQPNYVKGSLVDVYSASLLYTVCSKLNEDNQIKFTAKSLDEMVAISYKLVTM
jgi:hypothetical protein